MVPVVCPCVVVVGTCVVVAALVVVVCGCVVGTCVVGACVTTFVVVTLPSVSSKVMFYGKSPNITHITYFCVEMLCGISNINFNVPRNGNSHNAFSHGIFIL